MIRKMVSLQKVIHKKKLHASNYLKAIPLPIVDTETQETILRVPVVKCYSLNR